MYEVEPGFEIPKIRRKPSSAFTYPFAKMHNINDSFFIELVPKNWETLPGKKLSLVENLKARVYREAIRFCNLKPGFKVLIRSMTIKDDGECGIRVWRVK